MLGSTGVNATAEEEPAATLAVGSFYLFPIDFAAGGCYIADG